MYKILVFSLLLILSSVSYAYSENLDKCDEYSSIGVPSTDNVLCRKGYLLGYNKINKTPDWVIEHLTKSKNNIHVATRKSSFTSDPDLNAIDKSYNSDYLNSKYDKGHMAPAENMEWDKDAMTQCFYLSNIIPQVPNMNRKIWKVLEIKIRNLIKTRDELYTITGPIYADQVKKTIGKHKVAVPTHLYKIVYDPIKQDVESFIIPNKDVGDDTLLPTFIVPISEIEKQTGLNFMSSINKENFKNVKASTIWN